MTGIIGLSAMAWLFVLFVNDDPRFQGVGLTDPSHDESEGYAVSPDGTHVVGFSDLVTGVAPMEGGTRWYPNGSFEVIPSPGREKKGTGEKLSLISMSIIGTKKQQI